MEGIRDNKTGWIIFCGDEIQNHRVALVEQKLSELQDRVDFWSTVMKLQVAALVVLVISGIFLVRYVNKFWDREKAHMDDVDRRLDGFERRFHNIIQYAMLDNIGYLVDMSDFVDGPGL